MELLVAGRIVRPNVPVAHVFEHVWRPHVQVRGNAGFLLLERHLHLVTCSLLFSLPYLSTSAGACLSVSLC